MNKVPLEDSRIRKDLIARCLAAEQRFRGGEVFFVDGYDAETFFRDFSYRLESIFSGFKYGFFRKIFWPDRKAMDFSVFEEFINESNLSVNGPSASEYVRKILIPSMPVGFSKTPLSDGNYEYVTFSSDSGKISLNYCPVPKRAVDPLVIAGKEMRHFLDEQYRTRKGK